MESERTAWLHLGLTCNHNLQQSQHGLCPDCVDEFETDPIAWIEYGSHPTGDANSAELDRLMDEARKEGQTCFETVREAYRYGHDDGIPF